MRHGSRVICLAADFLCDLCQEYFQALNAERIEGLQSEDILEWSSRMQLRSGAIADLRVRLALEARWFVLRSQAMALVARGSLTKEEEVQAFAAFAECMKDLCGDGDAACLRDEVVRGLRAEQLSALEPSVFKWGYGPSGERERIWLRPLGVLTDGAGDAKKWWSEAVATCATPLRWTDYSGYPGFVSWDLWVRRAWVRARGAAGWGGAVCEELLVPC